MRIKDLATRATKLLTGNAWFVVDNGTKVEKAAFSEVVKQGIEEYAGSTLAGSARSVKSAIDSLNSNAYLLNGATLVPSGSDLNTYTTAGNYQIKFTSDANTISNMPVKTAGVLKVEISGYASNNYKRQTFYEFNNSNRHIRYTNDNGNTWSTWEQVPTRTEINNKLDKMASAVDIVYGESGASIDIDAINSQAYIIRINFSGADFSGTAPSGLSGNGAILLGFSLTAYGCQVAFGFGSNKIAIRNKPFNSTWQAWRYI